MSTILDDVLSGEARWIIAQGDNADLLPFIPDESIDAIVCDPPAGINFRGRTWDRPGVLGISGGVAMPATTASRNPSCRICKQRKRGTKNVCTCLVPDFDENDKRLADRDTFVRILTRTFREALRVLKPGGHALVWALPRTSSWTARALEDAGFEIRDSIVHHMFAQGYPKSKNLDGSWTGWGSALKPAQEHWLVARKPLLLATLLANVERYGTGALNIDGTRVFTDWSERSEAWKRSGHSAKPEADKIAAPPGEGITCHPKGRWPPNALFSHGRQEWLAIRDDVATLVVDAIHSYYGVEQALQTVWETDSRDAGLPCGAYVLQPGVRWVGTQWSTEEGVGQAGVRHVRGGLRGDAGVGPDGAPEVLLQSVFSKGEHRWQAARRPAHVRVAEEDGRRHDGEVPSGELVPMEGRRVLQQGLPARDDRDVAGSRAGDCQADGLPEDAHGEVRHGASDREGSGAWASSFGGRDCSPSKRDQGRQPSREPDDGSEGRAHEVAPRDREGASEVEGRERADSRRVPRLEVANHLLPEGWRRFFTVVDVNACEEIGTRKVTAAGGALEVRRGSTIAYEGGGGRESAGAGYFDENHQEAIPAFRCVAGCPACGTARLAPAGGEPPVCDCCGDLMVWACPVAELDRQSGVRTSGFSAGFMGKVEASVALGDKKAMIRPESVYADTGGASRFFPVFHPFIYAAKASSSEKSDGLEEKNSHATVKSIDLMKRLCRMVTPPGGIVLDFYAGSGSTGVAAIAEGFRFIGIEREAKHVAEGRARCALAERDLAEERTGQVKLFAPQAPAAPVPTRPAVEAPSDPQTSLFGSGPLVPRKSR